MVFRAHVTYLIFIAQCSERVSVLWVVLALHHCGLLIYRYRYFVTMHPLLPSVFPYHFSGTSTVLFQQIYIVHSSLFPKYSFCVGYLSTSFVLWSTPFVLCSSCVCFFRVFSLSFGLCLCAGIVFSVGRSEQKRERKAEEQFV